MKTVLEVKDVAKSFGGVHAVQWVTFEVYEGEILGLIGPNGSGKSTLFNCILGQLDPTRGECLVDGKSVTGLRPSQIAGLGISRTFQLLQVFPELTVTEGYPITNSKIIGLILSEWEVTPREIYSIMDGLRLFVDGWEHADPIEPIAILSLLVQMVRGQQLNFVQQKRNLYYW